MAIERVVFESEGKKVSGVLHLPEGSSSGCVIASHGLLSSKDSEKYVALGERMAREGISLLRFDFRGIGESEGTFEQDTVSGRIADLGAAIGFIRSRSGGKQWIGLVGSSLGGYVSLLRASMEPGVAAMVTWATPFHLDDLRSKKERNEESEYPLPAEPFFADLSKHRLLPLLPKISNILIIHGEADETVPVDQAWEIFHSVNEPKEIHVIEGADHRLLQPAHRQRAIDLTAQWFKKYL
jgi:uncharacterized protein